MAHEVNNQFDDTLFEGIPSVDEAGGVEALSEEIWNEISTVWAVHCGGSKIAWSKASERLLARSIHNRVRDRMERDYWELFEGIVRPFVSEGRSFPQPGDPRMDEWEARLAALRERMGMVAAKIREAVIQQAQRCRMKHLKQVIICKLDAISEAGGLDSFVREVWAEVNRLAKEEAVAGRVTVTDDPKKVALRLIFRVLHRRFLKDGQRIAGERLERGSTAEEALQAVKVMIKSATEVVMDRMLEVYG